MKDAAGSDFRFKKEILLIYIYIYIWSINFKNLQNQLYDELHNLDCGGYTEQK